jgi:hypothetical protein
VLATQEQALPAFAKTPDAKQRLPFNLCTTVGRATPKESRPDERNKTKTPGAKQRLAK